MKTYICYLVFTGLVIFGCQKDPIPKDIPECLRNRISEIKSQEKESSPGKIFQYRYKGQTVYFIPQRCCDVPSMLLDEQCNVICAPDGGISGGGDGRCPNFFDTQTDEKLIWQDTR